MKGLIITALTIAIAGTASAGVVPKQFAGHEAHWVATTATCRQVQRLVSETGPSLDSADGRAVIAYEGFLAGYAAAKHINPSGAETLAMVACNQMQGLPFVTAMEN